MLTEKSLQEVLSFDLEMFPEIRKEIHSIIRSVAFGLNEHISDEEVENLVYFFMPSKVRMFSEDEISDIKKAIHEYDSSKGDTGKSNKRTGGQFLSTRVKSIEHSKDVLVKKLGEIREFLHPKEVSRVSTEELLERERKQVLNASLNSVANSFKALKYPELRKLALSLVGEVAAEYLQEELPMLIAYKQLTGDVFKPGEVIT